VILSSEILGRAVREVQQILHEQLRGVHGLPPPPFSQDALYSGAGFEKVVKIGLASRLPPAVPLFFPSRPGAIVPSAPVRGLYHKERTDHGRQRKAIPN
jgi:hypothetical protein